MARRRKKKVKKKVKKTASSDKLKRQITLSHAELVRNLEALPAEKTHLTTEDVRAVFECHEVSVYRWVRQGFLKAYRNRARHRSNVYKREDVRRLIDDRFSLRPVSTDSSDTTGQGAGNSRGRSVDRDKDREAAPPRAQGKPRRRAGKKKTSKKTGRKKTG